MTMLNAEELNARLPDYWDAYMSDEDILVAVCDEVTFQIVDNKLEYPKTLEQIREEFGDANRGWIHFHMNYRKVERIIEGFLALAQGEEL